MFWKIILQLPLILSVLLFYQVSTAIPDLNQLVVKNINYQRCYKEERFDRKSSWVVLESGRQRYTVMRELFGNKKNLEIAVEKLKSSSEARIWLKSAKDSNALGIETATFTLNPQDGLNWEKQNRNWGMGLAGVLFLCGVALQFTTFARNVRRYA